MTGARFWRAREYLEPDGIFCATYGDGVANIDIPALIQFHKSHGKVGMLTGARQSKRFEGIEFHKNLPRSWAALSKG